MSEENRLVHMLPVPEDTKTAQEAIEVIRAWIIDQQLTLTLAANVFENPEVWGMLLADTAYHIANALARTDPNVDVIATMKAIHLAFNQKMSQPLIKKDEILVS